MFKPTIDHLYYLMKDMTVKPSVYKGDMNVERAYCMGFCYHTLLNEHKDFTIAQRRNSNYQIIIAHYKYAVWFPARASTSFVYTIEKYA